MLSLTNINEIEQQVFMDSGAAIMAQYLKSFYIIAYIEGYLVPKVFMDSGEL